VVVARWSVVALAGSCSAVAAAGPPPVVPWIDQRPVEASAHPPLAPPCRAASLAAHLFLQGATGSLVGGVDLTNRARKPCSLLGRPRASFLGQAAQTTKWRVLAAPATPGPADVLADPPGSLRALAPRKTASVSLFWSNWCGQPPARLELGLASGTSVVVPLSRAPRCDQPQSPSTLSVGLFVPAWRQLPPSSRLPLRASVVGRRPVLVKPGLRAFRVRRGSLLRFELALTNTGDRPFRFHSCPTYLEQLLPSVPAQAYVLNCRPAGVMAPGRTRLFAMQIPVPARGRLGNNGLSWELAPKTYLAPFASAAVWVVR
jgi:Domain of unknown function (DUF4232)